MKKIGLLFPGQGSQYTGMGKELFDEYDHVKEIFKCASETLGFDLAKIVFEGSEDILRQTQYTQPAIFAVSIAAFMTFEKNYAISPSNILAAGHSLGEYSALCAAATFNLEEGFSLVRERGRFIQQASENNNGTMAAIIGLNKELVSEICIQACDKGVCEAVNYNCPGQIVIAGSVDAVNKAIILAQEKGATKAVLLNVSGPFHSSLMLSASEMMQDELNKYSFNDLLFPVLTNIDGQPTTDKSLVTDKLVKQINSPVLWEDSIRKMIELGVEVFIEIGPQRILSGLMRRIDKTKKCLNIEDKKTLEKTLQAIGEI